MCFLFAALLFSACASRLGATDYYVSSTGNDANPGTLARPWKSTVKVNTRTFRAGDRILFKGGEWFYGGLTFDRLDAGTATNPIVVSSYGTGRA